MKGRIATTIVVGALIFFAGYAALFLAPDEKTMHVIQRIFYFHVPSWIAMFVAFSVVFVANIAYLATRKATWDCLGVSAAEVGVVCCTIGLATGPLWARPVWGIWWTWDARLDDPEKKATLSAVFGIFAFLDVPLVYVSNRLWRTQHPQPVILGGNGSGLDPTMGKVLLLCVIAVMGVMIIVLFDRYRLERLRHEFEELRLEVETRDLTPASILGKEST